MGFILWDGTCICIKITVLMRTYTCTKCVLILIKTSRNEHFYDIRAQFIVTYQRSPFHQKRLFCDSYSFDYINFTYTIYVKARMFHLLCNEMELHSIPVGMSHIFRTITFYKRSFYLNRR